MTACVTCGKPGASVRYHFNDDKSRSWYACGDPCALAYQLADARQRHEHEWHAEALGDGRGRTIVTWRCSCGATQSVDSSG